MLDRYVDDQRLKDAIACQGTIGTFAGPRDPGTAAIRLMHHQGDLLGLGSVWGYVEGGLGPGLVRDRRGGARGRRRRSPPASRSPRSSRARGSSSRRGERDRGAGR